MTSPSPSSPDRGHARSRILLVVLVAAVAFGASLYRAKQTAGASRNEGIELALARRGLRVERKSVLWLSKPPLPLLTAAAGQVQVVLRATTAPDEPHDIYLVETSLSPDGVLLSVGAHHKLTETSSVDEMAPVGHGDHFAVAERLLGASPSRIRLYDLRGAKPQQGEGDWSWLDRVQLAIGRYQKTGRLAGIDRITYTVEPPPQKLSISMNGPALRIEADGKVAHLDLSNPWSAPTWLSVEQASPTRPGKLVNWTVDRVRAVIGPEAIQYFKAFFFSLKDFIERRKEAVTGDTGASSIADDLGEQSLDATTRSVPVDPDIGFPPPPLVPWVKPTLPGEGRWNAKDEDPFIHTLPGLPPTFVTTFIRSDRRRKVTRVYVALWDPRLVQLNMMAGVAEPKSATGATGPGRIPREPVVMRRLAAAMNAGFQALHGEYGMMSDGIIYLPPKPYGATVALTRDGSTAFGTWPVSPAIPPSMRSYRQNMTVMVQDEKFNPYGRTWWGGTPADWEDRTHTVRTGICLTKEDFVGYFYGADISPRALSRAMIQTRCKYGVALDMNAGHSGMEFYKAAPAADFKPLGRHLRPRLEREGEVRDMPGWKFRARRLITGMGLMYFPRYIKREGRDFFYLTLRHVLPGRPLRISKSAPPSEGQWRVKGLPQHGFPYALALTELTLASGGRARVLKVDPRLLTRDASAAVLSRSKPSTPEPPPDAGAALELDAGAAPDPSNARAVVLAVNPVGSPGAKQTSLWWSPGGFSIAASGPASGAVRLASGPLLSASGQIAAALGVEQEGGALVYVELAEPGAAAGFETMAAVLQAAGCVGGIGLAEPWPIALGADSNLAAKPIRLPRSASQVLLFRQPGPGARRIFTDTPVVPLTTWHPLQARRIRYFKKRKPKDS